MVFRRGTSPRCCCMVCSTSPRCCCMVCRGVLHLRCCCMVYRGVLDPGAVVWCTGGVLHPDAVVWCAVLHPGAAVWCTGRVLHPGAQHQEVVESPDGHSDRAAHWPCPSVSSWPSSAMAQSTSPHPHWGGQGGRATRGTSSSLGSSTTRWVGRLWAISTLRC